LGDRANAERLLAETLERFPDYLFGQIAYANEYLDRGEVGRVSEMLDGRFELKLLYPDRDRFHVSEVIGFSTLMARYFFALGDRDRAEMYYQVLCRLDPEHPNTSIIDRLLHPGLIGRSVQKLLGKG